MNLVVTNKVAGVAPTTNNLDTSQLAVNTNDGVAYVNSVVHGAVPLASTFQRTIHPAGTSYSVTLLDIGSWVVFNQAVPCTLTIPATLPAGYAILASNQQDGGVSLGAIAGETVRGSTVLNDVTGYFALIKLTSNLWQSSER
jgi:hypothetical protein